MPRATWSLLPEDDMLKLHTIAEPSAETERSFDIGGTWDTSWTVEDGSCWLRDVLATKFPSSRVLSANIPDMLQTLGPSKGDVTPVLAEILHNRQTSRRSHRPVLFIGHGLGGSLLKQIFLTTHPTTASREDYRHLHDSIRGYVFLDTPHRSLAYPDIPALWRTFKRGEEASIGGTSDDLENAFETLSYINDNFRRLGGEELPAVCFYEGQTTLIGIRQSFIVPKEKALYSSRPVTSARLELSHGELCKLGAFNNADLHQVISALEKLFEVIESPEFGAPRPQMAPRRGVKLLSLDGGGVRGLFSLVVLEELLKAASRLDGSANQRLPCEYFDLIGGTSTGGLLAIMLGRLQMSIPSCITAYRNMSRDIFSRNNGWIPPAVHSVLDSTNALLGNPWFSGDRLKTAICQTVEAQLGPEEREDIIITGLTVNDVRLFSTQPQKTRCFVIAICEGHHRAERIRSYVPSNRTGRDTKAYTIWEAGRATSAAPMYFPAIQIGAHHYFDGGLQCNNPLLEVVDEAREEFRGFDIDAIVSIGIGKETLKEPFPGLVTFVSSVVGRLTSTEIQDEQFRSEGRFDAIRDAYFRFQEEEHLGKINLSAAERLDEIERLAREYVKDGHVKKTIERCAERMVGRA